ncbi:MAG: hypothetical protein HUU55_23330 [Myxococcales bacterium]|nr:hypothetical protein [Myxococcales bacterium]
MRVLHRILVAALVIWALAPPAVAQQPEQREAQPLSREERLQKIEQQKKERLEKLRDRRETTREDLKLQQEKQRERIRAYQERNPGRALPPNLDGVNPAGRERQRGLGRGDGLGANRAERAAGAGQGRLKLQTTRIHNDHNLRLARLNRIKTLATQAGDIETAQKVDALIARENAAFAKSKLQLENRARQLEQRAAQRRQPGNAPGTQQR